MIEHGRLTSSNAELVTKIKTMLNGLGLATASATTVGLGWLQSHAHWLYRFKSR